MAVSCGINVDDPTPAHGETITVTYSVDGNDPVDPSGATIKGRVVVGGIPQDVSVSVTVPGTPSAFVSYDVPASDNPAISSFTSTSDPAVFTAVVT